MRWTTALAVGEDIRRLVGCSCAECRVEAAGESVAVYGLHRGERDEIDQIFDACVVLISWEGVRVELLGEGLGDRVGGERDGLESGKFEQADPTSMSGSPTTASPLERSRWNWAKIARETSW